MPFLPNSQIKNPAGADRQSVAFFKHKIMLLFFGPVGVVQDRLEDPARTHDDPARVSTADADSGRPFSPSPLPGIRHHPFHGVPPTSRPQAISRFAHQPNCFSFPSNRVLLRRYFYICTVVRDKKGDMIIELSGEPT